MSLQASKRVSPVILLLAIFSVVGTLSAAEPAAVSHSIGFLGEGSAADIGALRKALGALGYDGGAIAVESRFAAGKVERLDELAGELVKREVELIVAEGLSAGEAARRQTRTIPIVVASRTETIKPFGNLTGATNLSVDLSAARLKLLKQIAPRISRVALLWHENDPISASYPKKMRSTAESLEMEIEPHKIRWARLEAEFDAIAAKPGAGVLIEPQPIFAGRLPEIARLCIKARLPAISGLREFAEAGGLVSYGLSVGQMWTHTAFLIDKIFTQPKAKRGAPEQLPQMQPTEFETAINLHTAGQLGISVPAEMLKHAARVVK